MSQVTDWLQQSEPWVRYRTLVDLLGQKENDGEVVSARKEMLADKRVRGMLAELAAWPGPALKRHNDAAHLLHKLVFLADLGLKAGDPGINEIAEKVMQHQSPEGAFQVVANVSPAYGGKGEDQLSWMVCDTPLILSALLKFGYAQDKRVQAALKHLAGLGTEDGWPCTVAPEQGKFRGPGRKADPCPYATLIALKALGILPEWRESTPCRSGTEVMLGLWTQRKERRPYLFGMGTNFAKLKAPFIWYDILHVTDVLSGFPELRQDKRLQEMAGIIKAKADAQGQFTAESIYKSWSEWDFGQKKTPSPGITLFVSRIIQRML